MKHREARFGSRSEAAARLQELAQAVEGGTVELELHRLTLPENLTAEIYYEEMEGRTVLGLALEWPPEAGGN